MNMPFQNIDLRLNRRSRGFTLIELMIVVAIIAIIAAVALPAYFGSIRKSRRADAITALNQIAQAQERWRANCPDYAASLTNPVPTAVADACLNTKGLAIPATVSSGYYTLAVSGTSATAYAASASAVGAQVNDTICASLTLTMTGGTVAYTAVPIANANQCWNR